MIKREKPFAGLDISHLSRIATAVPKPNYKGEWATIELQPDAFVPQRFTIGVVVQSPGERLHFKLIDDFKKFECLYQDQFPQKSIREILAYAEVALRRSVQSSNSDKGITFDTNCLSISPFTYASGADGESCVERIFDEVVVMAPSARTKASEFESMDTPRVRKLVNEELKRIAGMDYERIVIPDNQGILLDDGGVKHFLDLNLLIPGACGSVTSAVYKTTQSVEINLLKSSRDLTTYSRVRKMNNIGLFLLLPERASMESKDFKRITDTIEDHEWKLERDGFRVVSMDTPSDLAGEIYQWAKPMLA